MHSNSNLAEFQRTLLELEFRMKGGAWQKENLHNCILLGRDDFNQKSPQKCIFKIVVRDWESVYKFQPPIIFWWSANSMIYSGQEFVIAPSATNFAESSPGWRRAFCCYVAHQVYESRQDYREVIVGKWFVIRMDHTAIYSSSSFTLLVSSVNNCLDGNKITHVFIIVFIMVFIHAHCT